MRAFACVRALVRERMSFRRHARRDTVIPGRRDDAA
jgi:hypothetical protein